MKTPRASCRLYERAVKSIPGGVNSPVRACKSVGADPLFIRSAEGAVIIDADGNRYIDYIGSWGPMILGTVIRLWWRPSARCWSAARASGRPRTSRLSWRRW